MLLTLKNRFRFSLEKLILRGAHYRLLVIAAAIGLVSLSGGLLAFWLTTGFESPATAVWWAFLRLTDPGYLGDDPGLSLRTISTIITVLGYVLFMGSLIAIMTQWLDATIRHLEMGLTPISARNHVVILGWTNRTPAIVSELVRSEDRLKRFLKRQGVRKLRVAILTEDLSTHLRQELAGYLGHDWDDRQVIFRSGSPLNTEHLRRVDFMNAAVIIFPAADLITGGGDAADMQTLKTLLSISSQKRNSPDKVLPLMVTEIFDARKFSVIRAAYAGRIEILPSDAIISLLVVQNLRHGFLSYLYSELLSHSQGNEIRIRQLPRFAGHNFEDLQNLFPRAILLGVLRLIDENLRPYLNPVAGFRIEPDDRLVFIARSHGDTEPTAGLAPETGKRGTLTAPPPPGHTRKVLLLGWNDMVPALINECDSYRGEEFEIDILSAIPDQERSSRLRRFDLQPERVRIRHLAGDYTAPSDLRRVDPASYDNVVILGCDWLDTHQEADARAIHGLMLLREILAGEEQPPGVLLELLSPDNRELFAEALEEVLVSPLILSHMLAHVALRPELSIVFNELFRSEGAEIFFRSTASYRLDGTEMVFHVIQETVSLRGEIALGIRIGAEAASPGGGVHLNPERNSRWRLTADDEVIILTTSR